MRKYKKPKLILLDKPVSLKVKLPINNHHLLKGFIYTIK